MSFLWKRNLGKKMKIPNGDRKGQIAIFVIIAVLIVAGLVTYFAFRGQIFAESIPSELQPVFDYYASCIEDETSAAISLAGSQGGRIDAGEYIPGSEYAPFSSQLNFLGFPVPYWYYVTGNGLLKENVPTKGEIEKEISAFIAERINSDCNFDEFYARGFSIEFETPSVDTTIQDDKVIVDVREDIIVSKGESSARKTSHSVEISSKFGKMYNTALDIYEKETKDSFLENYSVDILRTYAPVDGVEIGCSGKIWKTREVVDGLKNGLEANIAAIKFEGDYYSEQGTRDKYFIVDLPVEQQINLLYSKTWPTKVEIAGAEDELMIASPVGTQKGMGTMGFCYSPYHFVYDISYPVLVQVFEGTEVFQFPVIVVVDKNLPRQAITTPIVSEEPDIDICQLSTKDIGVNVYDNSLNSIDANLSYECFNQKCFLGSTTNGVFSGKAPVCYNGYLNAMSGGYAEKRQLFSSNEENFADMILDREYDVKITLEVGGKALSGQAIINFDGLRSVYTSLPDVDSVKLSEGLYNITVYTYSISSLTIPSSTKKQCTEVSAGGILGIFGSTREECIDITIPEQKIESALAGGGKSEIYILPSDLEDGKITLRVDSLPTPNSIEELQNNFIAFEAMGVELVI